MDRVPVSQSVAANSVGPASISVAASELAARKVLKNTYLLLAATLGFSALTALAAMSLHLRPPGVVITLVGYFGLLFAVTKLRNSAWGVALVFALTGFMGYTLGPILSIYMTAIPNGGSVVATAFGITGLTFAGLSAYAVTSRRSFSFMGGFLFVGVFAAFLLGLAAIFFHLPMLSLAVSALFVLLSSGLILYQTGEIVNGGETNYVMATVSLYVNIFNLFMSLLNLLGVSSRN
jgi:modulator of FtsH protease